MLVAGDFFLSSVEQNEISCQIQQAFRAAQAVERAVLGRDLTGFLLQLVEPVANYGGAITEESLFLMSGQGLIDERSQRLVHFLPPDCPELRGGASGGVLGLILRDRQQQLRVQEQLGDLVVPLVSQVLTDGFGDWFLDIRTLALHHDQRDAVDEQHHIGAAGHVTA